MFFPYAPKQRLKIHGKLLLNGTFPEVQEATKNSETVAYFGGLPLLRQGGVGTIFCLLQAPGAGQKWGELWMTHYTVSALDGSIRRTLSVL